MLKSGFIHYKHDHVLMDGSTSVELPEFMLSISRLFRGQKQWVFFWGGGGSS